MICNIYIFVSTGLCLDCGVMSVHYDKCTLFYYNLVFTVKPIDLFAWVCLYTILKLLKDEGLLSHLNYTPPFHCTLQSLY